MSRLIVCVVCDEPKDSDEGLCASSCATCGHVTSSREVAKDSERIHPASSMTFGVQRDLFEDEDGEG